METKRKFRYADYEATEKIQITLGDALPEEHLARFVVSVVELLDLSEIYGRYSDRGGMPYAPEMLLSLLLYGYATGLFSSRKLERATYESIPFRYVVGNMHPDHDTINRFRQENLETLKGLFVQVLMIAHVTGYVKLGNISIDGSKVHADAPPRAMRSAMAACCNWSSVCVSRSKSCWLWQSSSIREGCPKAWT